jgi:formylglycine-generating enzyme required for sulfatase activity
MSDSAEILQAAEETRLRIVHDSSLAILGKGAAPALEEMVNRSLAQIQTNQTSGLSRSGGELVAPLKAGDEREFEIAPGVKIVMCWIPPGEFLMGSPENEEAHRYKETQHRVKITQGFWLAKTPITQAQWRAVMGNNPSRFKGDDRPVENVSWNDICGDESRTGGFLGKLNQFATTDGKFDLPTEAQWEYAARAGTTGRPDAGDLDDMAWYGENSGDETHPVGQKQANGWGLRDMLGNVYEWCADWLDDYDVNAVEDPTGPASGFIRIARGGSWQVNANGCRFAGRFGYRSYSSIYFGFRVARSSGSQNTPAAASSERSL